ncbi:MAG: hypothetical protein QOI66_5465 [Myxococcales bacterium]|jgi:hypothetical protein|nr:hypothetical protein [Myxococcales bacterium]
MKERLVELERAISDARRRLEGIARRLAALRQSLEGEDVPLLFEDEAGEESGPVDESELNFEALDYEDPERGGR